MNSGSVYFAVMTLCIGAMTVWIFTIPHIPLGVIASIATVVFAICTARAVKIGH